LFATVPPGVVLDATVGAGGHAAALLSAYPHLGLFGIDRDPTALEIAASALASFGPRVVLHHARFTDLDRVVGAAWAAGRGHWPSSGEAAGAPCSISGALFDLGVSSMQLDRAERGFSYRRDAPLDMRMDPGASSSALDIVNGAGPDEMASWFRANGEGRLAGRIARAIVAARPIATTARLAEVVASAVPAAVRRRGHPAGRVFQAIRIAVNEESEELAAGDAGPPGRRRALRRPRLPLGREPVREANVRQRCFGRVRLPARAAVRVWCERRVPVGLSGLTRGVGGRSVGQRQGIERPPVGGRASWGPGRR
jgi:16S rRNA (cytosine1402-N4)-methyltransferase